MQHTYYYVDGSAHEELIEVRQRHVRGLEAEAKHGLCLKQSTSDTISIAST